METRYDASKFGAYRRRPRVFAARMIAMQVTPHFLPLVRINAPEVYADASFQEWLNQVSAHGRTNAPGDRIATWHWPGHEPNECSDIFMLVDGLDGSDSDMPQHCWDVIVQAVYDALDGTYPQCVVWLTNAKPAKVASKRFPPVPTRTSAEVERRRGLRDVQQ